MIRLFFADDSLLICLAEAQEAVTLTVILTTYEEISGQKLNLKKSEVCFSRNVGRARQEIFSGLMGIPRVDEHGKYLGLPSVVGRAKKPCFAYLKERVWNRISGWKENLLPVGGKEIMLKSVAEALTAYTMSIFKLLKKLCDAVEILMNRYWWGQVMMVESNGWLEKIMRAEIKWGDGI